MNIEKVTSLKITKERLGRNIWVLLHSSAAALKNNAEVVAFKTMWESMVKIFQDSYKEWVKIDQGSFLPIVP